MRQVHRTVLTGARVVLPDAVEDPGLVVVENGHIAERPSGTRPADTEVSVLATRPASTTLHLPGHWIVPGFVDLHLHGGGGASFSSGSVEAAERVLGLHRRHGTTTALASIVTRAVDDLCRQAAELSELVEDGELAGIHFEGPFLSEARRGAHQRSLLRAPDPATVRELLSAARGAARMLTLAPELPGALDSIRLLVERGVIAAVGHTEATYDKTRDAVEAGATVATHLFNAMPPTHHREPGPALALLEDPRVTVELINDGVHLHPAVFHLAFSQAGPERVALVTDAMGAAGLGDGLYSLGPLRVRVAGGVARLVEGDRLAGSTLTLDTVLRRSVRGNGLPIEHVVQALSTTPARLLNLDDHLGSLEPGKRADLVVLDEELSLVAVMRHGTWIAGGERLMGKPVA